MATDGPNPAPCDEKVFRSGKVVFVTHSIPSNAMEHWVQSLAKESGQRVDWHFFCGRAVVKALGDMGMISAALATLKPEHDRLIAQHTT